MAAIALVVGGFGFVAGPLGVLAGLGTAVLLYALGTPYAVAGGHIALVALVPPGIEPLALGIIESGFVALLVVAMATRSYPVADVIVASASALGLAGIAWLLVATQPLWVAASTQLGALALAGYASHRLERVRLGLVGTDTEGPTTAPSADS